MYFPTIKYQEIKSQIREAKYEIGKIKQDSSIIDVRP